MGILNSLFFKFICFLLLIHALNVKLFKKSASNIFFLQIHSTQEITNNQDNTNIIENFDLNISEESSNNIEETSSENSTTYNNVTLKEKNETNETDKENKPINYDILEDDNYGPEVKDIKSSFKMSETSSLEKISSFTLNLKAKIENMTENLESKINAFTDRITNKSKELDKLMLFNELKTLKLAIEIEKSNMIDIDSEIFQLKSVLAKLLRKSPSSIQTICSLFKTCGECLRNKHCGWCQEQERCMLGNENSPRFELCQFYSYQLCDGNNCLKYKDCSVINKLSNIKKLI